MIKQLVKHMLEFMLLVCIMAIQSEDDWNGLVNTSCPCKWYKDGLNLGYTVYQICPS